MPGPRAAVTQKGFTLLELIIVLAIFALVSSMLVPLAIGTFRDADRAKAEVDVQEIATALSRFCTDLRRPPACAGADCSRIGLSGSAGLRFLAVGEGSGDLSARYPDERPSLPARWELRANQDPTRPQRNNAFNHLIRNDPNADGVVDASDYPKTGRRWQGPYLTWLGLDPWGKAYIVSVGAMEPGGQPVAPRAKGWILSAGPNGVIDTAPDAAALGGDDIGLIFDSRSGS